MGAPSPLYDTAELGASLYLNGFTPDGAFVYLPCALLNANKVAVQDWRVEVDEDAVRVLTIDGAPYPELSDAEWLVKCDSVEEAMIEAYVSYNFEPRLLGASISGLDDEHAKAFARKEARRLVPRFRSFYGRDFPLSGGPVQTMRSIDVAFEDALRDELALFNPKTDVSARALLYGWASSPLCWNSLETSRARFETSASELDLSKAFTVEERTRLAPEVSASISDAMQRPPSQLRDSNTAHYTQTFMFATDAGLVHRKWVAGDPVPSQLERDEFVASFKAVESAFVTKYVQTYFPDDTDAVLARSGDEMRFEEWCAANDFNPRDEASRVIGHFNQWGFLEPALTTAPGKRPVLTKTTAVETDRAAEAYGLKTVGIDGHSFPSVQTARERHAAWLNVESAVKMPVDVLWDGEKPTMRALMNPLPEAQDFSANVKDSLPPLIKLRKKIAANRKKRAEKTEKEIKRIGDTKVGEERHRLLDALQKINEGLLRNEDMQIERLERELNSVQSNTTSMQERAYLWSLPNDYERVAYLRGELNDTLAKHKDASREEEAEILYKFVGMVGSFTDLQQREIDHVVESKRAARRQRLEQEGVDAEALRVELARSELVWAEFARLARMTPEERTLDRKAKLAQKSELQLKRRVPYETLSWHQKMERDRELRQEVLERLDDDQQERSFNLWVASMSDAGLAEQDRDKRDRVTTVQSYVQL